MRDAGAGPHGWAVDWKHERENDYALFDRHFEWMIERNFSVGEDLTAYRLAEMTGFTTVTLERRLAAAVARGTLKTRVRRDARRSTNLYWRAGVHAKPAYDIIWACDADAPRVIGAAVLHPVRPGKFDLKLGEPTVDWTLGYRIGVAESWLTDNDNLLMVCFSDGVQECIEASELWTPTR